MSDLRDEQQRINRAQAMQRTKDGGAEHGGAPALPAVDPTVPPRHLVLDGKHASIRTCPACKDLAAQGLLTRED
jgi:hypothetical protein